MKTQAVFKTQQNFKTQGFFAKTQAFFQNSIFWKQNNPMLPEKQPKNNPEVIAHFDFHFVF